MGIQSLFCYYNGPQLICFELREQENTTRTRIKGEMWLWQMNSLFLNQTLLGLLSFCGPQRCHVKCSDPTNRSLALVFQQTVLTFSITVFLYLITITVLPYETGIEQTEIQNYENTCIQNLSRGLNALSNIWLRFHVSKVLQSLITCQKSFKYVCFCILFCQENLGKLHSGVIQVSVRRPVLHKP